MRLDSCPSAHLGHHSPSQHFSAIRNAGAGPWGLKASVLCGLWGPENSPVNLGEADIVNPLLFIVLEESISLRNLK